MAGRPSKYQQEYHVPRAYKLSLLGLTIDEIAVVFEIHRDTVYDWQKNKQEFSDALKAGKEEADSKVAKSLYKRALGYKYKESTFEKIVLEAEKDNPIETDLYKKRIVTKEVPPDTTAQIFWLKNRQPSKWRDKTEVGGSVVNYNVELTKEEARRIAKDLEEEV